MIQIFSGTLLLSILHALIPSHWLPITAMGQNLKWTSKETLLATLYLGIAHVGGTLLLGLIFYFVGHELDKNYTAYFEKVVPVGLILIGIVFIYRHHTHHHFHIDEKEALRKRSTIKIISSLMLLMFFSPCLEVEAYFLMAGKYHISFLVSLATMYAIITVGGMLLWVSIAIKGLKKTNWHKLEHNAGLITGVILILTGIVTYLLD